jgi:hypothetical protein
MNEIIERVARAIFAAHHDGSSDGVLCTCTVAGESKNYHPAWTFYADGARAALAELRKPTEAMIERMARAMCKEDGGDPDGTWIDGTGELRIPWHRYKPLAKVAIAMLQPPKNSRSMRVRTSGAYRHTQVKESP